RRRGRRSSRSEAAMSERVVKLVVFEWYDERGPEYDVTATKAFTDQTDAQTYLSRCYRRISPEGTWWEASGGIRDVDVTFAGPFPASLWVVRWRSGDVAGVFASREEADAFFADQERAAAESGNPSPLFEVGNLEGLMRFSDFDLSVFGDWLTDPPILTPPHPPPPPPTPPP